MRSAVVSRWHLAGRIAQGVGLGEVALRTLAAALAALLTCSASSARAGQTNVAVADNFAEPAKEIAQLFKQRTGHEAVLSVGATGRLYTQIARETPFQVFLSADARRPKAAIARGYAVPGSRFTYAIGKLVLWSRVLDVTKGEEALRAGAFSKLSISNPSTAPYGTAAMEVITTLRVYDAVKAKIVQGASVAQVFQFVDTKEAELGFVALSQLYGVSEGTRWLVPQNLYAPIRQDAILLKKGANDQASKAFLEFLKGPEARAVIKKFGYSLD